MARKSKVKWYPGDLVIDAGGTVAERSQEGEHWIVLGWNDVPYSDSDLTLPLRRLVPVDADGRNLYRITYQNGKVKHGHGRVLGAVVGAMRGQLGYNRPVKFERCPEPAWEDVTSEYITD